jgi:PadR family transcriptional regulator PadR
MDNSRIEAKPPHPFTKVEAVAPFMNSPEKIWRDRMKDLSLTEEMFLLAVWKLKDDAYGVTIRQYVVKETDRNYPIGTIYSALDKMVRNGYLRKTVSDPTPERGGRSKNYYHITQEGIEALKNAMELKNLLWDAQTKMALSKS